MERILQTPFSQIIPTWNNRIEQAGGFVDSEGNTLNGNDYSAFRRITTCEYVRTGQQSSILPASLIHVKVDVTYRGASLVTLHRLISE